MRKAVHIGLAIIWICALGLGVLIVNYEAYGISDSFKEISEIASIYSIDKVLCALEIYCNLA